MSSTNSMFLKSSCALSCVLFASVSQSVEAHGWRRYGSVPMVQSITSDASVVNSGGAKKYGALLQASCMPGLVISVTVPPLLDTTVHTLVNYSVMYDINLPNRYTILSEVSHPGVFIRLEGADAKIFAQNIAEGSQLNLTAESQAVKFHGQFDVTGFHEVVIPALASCL